MKQASKTHQEPTKASLKEMPEVDFSKARVRGNAHAARIAKAGITVQVGRGRPRKLTEVGGTSPRSVRFPDEVWEMLERRARRRASRSTRLFERRFSRGSNKRRSRIA